MILAPDQVQRTLYKNEIEPNLKPGDALLFGHGFNIRFGYITPEGVDVSWSPPRAPATSCAVSTSTAAACPVLVAVEQDASGNAWRWRCRTPRPSAALRAGGIKTTFTEETETDLFGEQAVLCGGASQLVSTASRRCRGRLPARGRVLRVPARAQAHRRPDVRGRHRQAALVGLRHRRVRRLRLRPAGHRPDVKENMQAVLADIQNGAFAERFIADQDAGAPEFKALRAKGDRAPDRGVGQDRPRAAQA
jgi:ketol-acid reductoisomerase